MLPMMPKQETKHFHLSSFPDRIMCSSHFNHRLKDKKHQNHFSTFSELLTAQPFPPFTCSKRTALFVNSSQGRFCNTVYASCKVKSLSSDDVQVRNIQLDSNHPCSGSSGPQSTQPFQTGSLCSFSGQHCVKTLQSHNSQ